jgi:two-component system, response regulator, stage 0 sporulation protein F
MPKILAIDDEKEFTDLIKNYFSQRGFEVFVADHGTAGLSLLKVEKPEVCLIDFKMPGIGGDEVLKKILRGEPKTKCIMITAFDGDISTHKRLLALGAYGCFDKPLPSLKDLEQKIKEALSLCVSQ